jgi:hypothetical protein
LWKKFLQAGQNSPEARRANARKRRRTLKYVDAKRVEPNEAYGRFHRACLTEAAVYGVVRKLPENIHVLEAGRSKP